MRAVQIHADRPSRTPTAPEPETPFLGRLHLLNSKLNGTAPPAEARLKEHISR
ncbi:hypothetical protein CGCA056_v000361 [Colletotrichum aenigma]|uniref:uncharacterized protein n=1 Tax=Colletotrichum aenigma TaxID=1215731 RepID=UPI0018729EE3|nr:uncharacterized protein CGCA056_v000361 [Colletotrichum aenigma]KAF5527536.1 hypothetical protein CGCA056_v000361 [Colletotrichum aenigma]